MTTGDEIDVAGSESGSGPASMTVSIVITTRETNNLDRLKLVVESLRQLTSRPHEVVLVFDGNVELQAEARQTFADVKVVPNGLGQGKAGAIHTGVRAATGAIVAFLEDDMVVAPGWLEAIVGGFSSPTIVGVLGAIAPRWPYARPWWMPTGLDRMAGVRKDLSSSGDVPGNFALRRSAIVMSNLGEDVPLVEGACMVTRALVAFPGARLQFVAQASSERLVPPGEATFGHVVRRYLAGVRSSVFVGRALDNSGASASPEFVPVKVVEVNLDQPLRAISARRVGGSVDYGAAHVVVRGSGQLRAVLQVPLYGESLSAKALEALVAEYRSRNVAPVSTPVGRVRVIVATRDRTESLARCLDSLLEQDYPDYEIVVVDNAPSSNATSELVHRRYVPTGRVRYVLEQRPGVASAHNRGLDGLAADFVAITDDDIVADKSWLSTLVRPFAEAADIGCVTGAILPAELETRGQYLTERHGAFLKGVNRRDFDVKANRPSDPLFPYASGKLGSGANMAFRSSALAAIGGFDPALGSGSVAKGGQELAAFTDTVLAGYRIVYNPDALIWHYHRRGIDGMERQAFGYGVGLGAHLTRQLVRNPMLVFHFIAVAPAAAKAVFSRKSAKNARLPSDYPRDFIRRERLGILAGLPAYLKSRRLARQANAGREPAGARPDWRSS